MTNAHWHSAPAVARVQRRLGAVWQCEEDVRSSLRRAYEESSQAFDAFVSTRAASAELERAVDEALAKFD